MQLVELMQIAVQEKASDIHLTVGRPPMLRIHGELRPDRRQAGPIGSGHSRVSYADY